MSDELKSDHVFASPSRIAWDKVDKLQKLVVVPVPSHEDLNTYGFLPVDLAYRGLEVPNDEEEALTFARQHFMASPAFKEWRQRFFPEKTTLWPCKFSVSPQAAADAIYNAGLSCVIVKGIVNGVTEVSGIAMIPGADREISDHLAAAYICSGQLPPADLMTMALSRKNPVMKGSLIDASKLVSSALHEAGNRISNRAAEIPFSSVGDRRY